MVKHHCKYGKTKKGTCRKRRRSSRYGMVVTMTERNPFTGDRLDDYFAIN